MNSIRYYIMPAALMAVGFIFLISCNPASEEERIKTRTEYWIEDLDYLAETLPSQHANLYRFLDEDVFLSSIEMIKSNLEFKTDATVFIELFGLFSDIRDVNTYLQPVYNFTELPVRIMSFPDGFFITEITATTNTLYGKKVTNIGGISTEVLAPQFGTVVQADNSYGANYQMNELLNKTLFLKYYGFTEHIYQAQFTFDGFSPTLIVEEPDPYFQSIFTFDDFQLPVYLEALNDSYYQKTISESNVSYLHLRNVDDLIQNEFSETVNNWINGSTNTHIIDLRFCRSDRFSANIQTLYDSIEGHNLNLYIMIDNSTVNYGVDIAIYLKDHFGGTIIGTPAGGRINHSAEVEYFELPNNLTRIHYPTVITGNDETDSNVLFPDINIQLLSNHYFNGEDPLLQYVIQN